MKIYVVGSSKNKFLPLDDIREKFLIDQPHEGDNIDFLNPWYCELTGLYYLWKHVDDDIVGLEHYRRYFLGKNGAILDKKEIENILINYDIICAKEHYPNGNGTYIFTWPIRNGKRDYFLQFIATLKNLYGDEVAKHFNDFLYGQWHCQGNLMIGKRKIIEKYLEWLFNTLIEYNKTVNLTENTKRINAYISEFFFGAWLTLNNYKIYWSKYNNCGNIID